MSQNELISAMLETEHLNVPVATSAISDWEHDRKLPTSNRLRALRRALGVDDQPELNVIWLTLYMESKRRRHVHVTAPAPAAALPAEGLLPPEAAGVPLPAAALVEFLHGLCLAQSSDSHRFVFTAGVVQSVYRNVFCDPAFASHAAYVLASALSGPQAAALPLATVRHYVDVFCRFMNAAWSLGPQVPDHEEIGDRILHHHARSFGVDWLLLCCVRSHLDFDIAAADQDRMHRLIGICLEQIRSDDAHRNAFVAALAVLMQADRIWRVAPALSSYEREQLGHLIADPRLSDETRDALALCYARSVQTVEIEDFLLHCAQVADGVRGRHGVKQPLRLPAHAGDHETLAALLPAPHTPAGEAARALIAARLGTVDAGMHARLRVAAGDRTLTSGLRAEALYHFIAWSDPGERTRALIEMERGSSEEPLNMPLAALVGTASLADLLNLLVLWKGKDSNKEQAACFAIATYPGARSEARILFKHAARQAWKSLARLKLRDWMTARTEALMVSYLTHYARSYRWGYFARYRGSLWLYRVTGGRIWV